MASPSNEIERHERQDLTALLISHPELRDELLADESARLLVKSILDWMDEFRNIRECDGLFDDIAIRATVALAFREIEGGGE